VFQLSSPGNQSMSDLSGVLCVDKPLGMTSHDVVGRTRRVAGLRRVGHAGTLDPLATGVLLLCLGRAARLIEYLVGHDKVYETTVRLGQTTATYDAEGEVLAERPFLHLTLSQIEAALEAFRGDIVQQPPIYSAIKQGGQPLYKLARQGKTEVARPYRPVTIHELTRLSWEPPHLSLRIACSSGTYIRSLGYDLGEALGCGGHLSALRRLAVGRFWAGIGRSPARPYPRKHHHLFAAAGYGRSSPAPPRSARNGRCRHPARQS
jgi:tRNA pseudouridine55 synthase